MSKDYTILYELILSKSKNVNGCLESTYKPRSGRYCYIKHKQKVYSVHRLWWEIHNGDIPKGMFICHTCDNPRCFKLDHLFLGTALDNSRDMQNKKRNNYSGATKYSKAIAEKAIRMKANGATYKEIGEKLNIPWSSITGIFKRKYYQDKVENFFGVDKYDEQFIQKCFELRESGVLCKDIQKIMNIPKRSLSRIFNRRQSP